MPEPTKFDSGTPHVVLNVARPNGNTHAIAVPEDTDLADLHSSLVDSGYRFPEPQPTAAGAVENSEKFRKAANDAWVSTKSGLDKAEAGFWVGATGGTVPTAKTPHSAGDYGHEDQIAPLSALGAVHTHDRSLHSEPSPGDIKTAQKNHTNVWVVSAGGLYQVDRNGAVTHIFKSPSWMRDANPK